MDWLVSLQTFGTSFLYPALKFIVKLCYIVTIPLYYPVYYLLALVAFLLSPIWYTLRAVSSTAVAVVALATKLKYIYIYVACAAIIGICVGCILHETSSFIFVLLGVGAPQKRELDHRRSKLPHLDEEEFDDLGSTTQSEDSSSILSMANIISRRGKSKQGTNDDVYDLFEKQWKLVRSPEKPRKRRRGLLAQTIHEESSSDFSG
ncbi:hypothetical protein F4677DRAFT_52923 [Hypoxylon crocopeplum]|nr:hypothetical protein F4677DRAFT_52923 [Hypoxylon crocopeplum]